MLDIHDLGGHREHFAPIDHTPNEPVFTQQWERRVFGLVTFLETAFGPDLDSFRSETEQLPREEYFGPYYGHWLGVLERRTGTYLAMPRAAMTVRVAVAKRVVPLVMTRPTLPGWVNRIVLPRIVGNAKKSSRAPRFAVGDTVRVRGARATGHTRQPGYVTGRLGRVVAHRGAAVFADAHAATGSTAPEHLYTVAFDGSELWGEAAEANTEVCLELFEPYLEPA